MRLGTAVVVLLVVVCSAHAASFSEQELRDEYYASESSSKASDKFYEKMKSVAEDAPPVQLGYKGMSALLKSKHSINPKNKLSYFSEGKQLLEQAISRAPENVELRFLRYGVQDNAPFFLDYTENLKEDRKALVSYLASVDINNGIPDLASRIAQYLNDQGDLSSDEQPAVARISDACKKGNSCQS